MLVNYIKTAWRFLSKNPSFTIINILGLTSGITAFLMITLFLQNELSFDKHLPRSNDTYRLVGIQEPSGLDIQHVAITSGGWADFIRENIPDVQEVFRIMGANSGTIEVGDKVFRETLICFSEGNVITHMGLPLVQGNPSQANLSKPNQALISKEVALRMYDTPEVVGNTFRNGNHLFTIIGVYDNEGIKSHWDSNIFLSLSTVIPELQYFSPLVNNSLATYLVLQPGADIKKVEGIINNQYREFISQETFANSMPITFYLQNAADIYLRSGHLKFQMIHNQGNLKNVYIFSLVAILILVIACINFINLATANSSKRSREVGLRKVLGASRNKLAMQFIGESMLITFFSLMLSLGILELALPQFNTLLDTELSIDFIGNPLFNVGLISVLLVVGLVSGLYPAVYLSRFQAVQILKAQSNTGKPKSVWLRKILVILQFIISTSLIMATLVVMNQVSFMKQKNRGYDPREVIALPLGIHTPFEQIESFRTHLLSYPEVQSIGIASNYNGVAGQQSAIEVSDSLSTRLMVRYGYVNPDFFPTMAVEFSHGRNFSHQSGTDMHQAVIINESTAKALGWDDPIGKQFRNNSNPDYDNYTVIGVIKDYHYYSLHNPIEPAIYLYLPGQMPMLNIRFKTLNQQELVAKIESDFKEFFPQQYFNSYFVEDILGRQTRTEENIMKLFSWFSILCIVISCLGLFGLTSFMVNQRRKEISLRKILGSSVIQINRMLVTSFLRWIVIASLIALPLTYLALLRWLNNYPYHINIGPVHFGIPLLIIVLIAAITILALSTKAALQNPADNLKYE